MKSYKYIFIIILITNLDCASQSTPRIAIEEPTINQEAISIWRTINDIVFFKMQGYSISLPEEPLIDSLTEKSKNGNFGNEDFPAIYELVENQIFKSSQYKQAIQKVEDQFELINNLILELEEKRPNWDWKFKMFDNYKVVFTLYGTGGSYDPDEGTITILTNENGGFKGYNNPANTIIHEIVHMGLEGSIVQKYKLSHGLKERLVDTLVYLMFKEQLPEYRIQNMGDSKIDKHLTKKGDIATLDAIISNL